MTDYGMSERAPRPKTLGLPFSQKSYKTARPQGGSVEDAFFQEAVWFVPLITISHWYHLGPISAT
jgi:hypothetical protein